MSSQTPFKVLCVCLGNICRSPTAEAILRHYCELEKLNVVVDSAGTSNYHPNAAPDERSQFHAAKRGYDLSSLRARQVQLDDFLNFDLILAMDHENLSNIMSLRQKAIANFNQAAEKARVHLMSEFDPVYPQHAVPDPYYGGAQGFESVLDQCESSSRAWIKQIKSIMNSKG